MDSLNLKIIARLIFVLLSIRFELAVPSSFRRIRNKMGTCFFEVLRPKCLKRIPILINFANRADPNSPDFNSPKICNQAICLAYLNMFFVDDLPEIPDRDFIVFLISLRMISFLLALSFSNSSEA